jgi:hypothetical protein
MYTFVDFTSQIVGRRGVPCPTNKGVSYTNLVCWLGRDLKNRLLLLLLLLLNTQFNFASSRSRQINKQTKNVKHFKFKFIKYYEE